MNQILKKYGVTYVYVGPLERSTYGEAGLEKFKPLPGGVPIGSGYDIPGSRRDR